MLVFGLIMITSIGLPKSIVLSQKSAIASQPELAATGQLDDLRCENEYIDCFLLLKKHAQRVFVGIILMFIFIKIPYRFWKKVSIPILALTVLSLFVVVIMGSNLNTSAQSWLVLFNTTLQPTEFAKLGLILYLAAFLATKREKIQDLNKGFIPYAVISGLVILPVVLQPDLGSAMVLVAISAVLYFVAGARIKHIALAVGACLLITAVLVPNVEYLNKRFKSFINPTEENCLSLDNSGEVIRNFCWQSDQANLAVGVGGFWGRGLTQGVQKLYWLPQASDDYIFAASAEELGFYRIIFVVLGYLFIAYRGFQIAIHSENRFAMFTAIGISTWIIAQAYINISVNIGLFPVTGITLPFISYGGSSLIATLIAVGILLNISTDTNQNAYRIQRGGNRRTRRAKPRNYRKSNR